MPKLNIDEILRHETGIARLARGQFNDLVKPGLESTYNEIRKKISDAGLPRSRSEMRSLESEIRKIVRDNSAWAAFTTAATDFAMHEADVFRGITDTLTGEQVSPIARGKLQRYVTESMMSLESGQRTETALWSEFVRANEQATTRNVNNIVRTAYTQGWGVQELGWEMRRVFDGAIARNAQTLANTGYQHFANRAREAMSQQYDAEMEWALIVTFDSKTSPICRYYGSIDERWAMGEPGRPIPPLHHNCRTTGIAVPAGTELTGTRSAVGGTADGEPDPGQVRAATTYDNWLKRQPAGFIDDTLGPTRGKLFRQGDIELQSFYDMTGRQLTLDELRSRDADLFRRVFGD